MLVLVYEFGSASLFRSLEAEPPSAADGDQRGSSGDGAPLLFDDCSLAFDAEGMRLAAFHSGEVRAREPARPPACAPLLRPETAEALCGVCATYTLWPRLCPPPRTRTRPQAALRVWSFATTTWRSAAHSMLRGGTSVLCSKKIVVEPARQVGRGCGLTQSLRGESSARLRLGLFDAAHFCFRRRQRWPRPLRRVGPPPLRLGLR